MGFNEDMLQQELIDQFNRDEQRLIGDVVSE
jgi:hypothetical protein